jgi:hypothetical protein
MPFKDPEKRKVYNREYKRRQRAKEREGLSNPACQTQKEPIAPRSLVWNKPYKRLGDYYLQDGWLFDCYSGRPVKRYEETV